MPIPTRNSGEHETDFLQRCMSDEKMKSEYDTEQRYAICRDALKMAVRKKISFDYDGTLSTAKGKELEKRLSSENTIYIISARGDKQGMLSTANSLNIPESRVYATGSNKAKIEKINELGIDIHYDNNPDVIKQLGSKGKLL